MAMQQVRVGVRIAPSEAGEAAMAAMADRGITKALSPPEEARMTPALCQRFPAVAAVLAMVTPAGQAEDW